MTSQLAPGSSQSDYNRAKQELDQLDGAYKEMAADTALAAAGWAPPPWGTAADVASLGKSLFKGDWGGALFDAIGIVPVVGDAAKAGRLGRRAKAIEAAIDAAKVKLARHAANLIEARRNAAKAYWDKIVTEGRRRYDEAIKSCSTVACKESKVGAIGEHYNQTPVSGAGKGSWQNGPRGDGDFVPDPSSPLGQQLQKFRDNPALNPTGKNLDGIPYRNGFPNFDDFVVPAGAGKAQVEIIQAGNSKDFAAADAALKQATGLTKSDLEKRFGALTWHHKEDGVTMQLLPEKLHGGSNGSGHVGGTALQKREEF